MFPATTNQSSTFSYVAHFIKLDIKGIEFVTGLKIEDVRKGESKSTVKPNVFELNVKSKDDLNVTSKLLPIFISDTESHPKDLVW